MSVSTVHVLHGIQNSSTFLSQISSARPSPQIERILSEPSGLPFPLFTGAMGVDPVVSFETPQIKTILDLTGALSSIVDLSGANTDLYYKKVTDLGRRTADASLAHKRLRMSQAWLGLDSITAGDRQEAVASCRLGTTFDGTNNPLVPAGSVALAGTPTAAEHFVAGPVKVNIGGGLTSLPGILETRIEFNRRYVLLSADGELYNTFAALEAYSPVITVRCLEHAWETYGLNGSAITALSVWLRKVASTGRVADATAEHILFQATAGTIQVGEIDGGGNQAAAVSYRFDLVGADASTEPITVDTTAAIS